MADQILQPTSNTTPDQGGTTAVAGASNTGHGGTTASANQNSPGSSSVAKSCRWSAFQSAAATPSRLTLKVTWSWSSSVDVTVFSVGTGQADTVFTVEYTTNGGGLWTDEVLGGLSQSGAGSQSNDDSGTASIVLNPTTPINQIQVRDLITADASVTGDASADASITATVSSIQLEVEFGSNRIILGMM